MCCGNSSSLKWSEMTIQAIFTYLFCVLSLIFLSLLSLNFIMTVIDSGPGENLSAFIIGILIFIINIAPLAYLLKLMKTKQIDRLNKQFFALFLMIAIFPWIMNVFLNYLEEGDDDDDDDDGGDDDDDDGEFPLFLVEIIRTIIWVLIWAFNDYELKLLKNEDASTSNVSSQNSTNEPSKQEIV